MPIKQQSSRIGLQSKTDFDIRSINRLALPAILMGIAEPLIALADTAFIGRVGTVELAAVGIAGGFYLMTVWILAQTLTAIAAIVSRHYGKDTLGEVATLVPQAFFANVLLGLGFYFLTIAFATEIFGFYNAEGELLDACMRYYSIRAIGFPFTLGTFLLFGTFRGLQNTSWAMGIAMAGAALNGLLDYILIFGVEGRIEPMGLEGAAWAGLAAQVLMCFLAIAVLIRRTPFSIIPTFTLNPNYRWLAGMSFDLFIRTILLNVTFYLAVRYATGYGEEVMAAHTIALNIWLFSSFFIDGYAHAGNAIAGRLVGAESFEALSRLGKKIEKISLGIGAAMGVVYAILSPMMGEFFTNEAAVIDAFDSIFWLVIIAQPINAVAFAYDGIFKGLGEMKYLRNLLAVATILGFLPVAVWFHYTRPGLTGIWVAFTVWMVIRAAAPVVRFRRRYSSVGQ
ncbi:MAG: MATE family efflux transporter [Flavobacteriales bacterium]|nr:MATE family efflux transporter [Flavobacteriales bacterium]